MVCAFLLFSVLFVVCLVVVDGLVLSFINYLGVVLFVVFCCLDLVWVGILVVQVVTSRCAVYDVYR